MIQSPFPWLTMASGLPLAASFLVRRISDPDRARRLGALTITASLAAGLAANASLPTVSSRKTWVVDGFTLATLGEPRPLFGIDGLSGPLVPHFCLLTLAVILAAPRRNATGKAISQLLFGCSLTLGLLTSLDLGVFALLWILSLVWVPRQIAGSGRPDAARASRVVGRYLALAGMAMMAATLLIARASGAAGFAAPLHIPHLANGALPDSHELAIFLLILLAAMPRKGILPFHSWYPDMFETLPPGTASLFVAAHLGAYVILRLAIPLAPGPAQALLPILTTLSVLTSLLGSLVALAQTRPRRALAYLTLSQSALVMTGLLGRSTGGIAGALVQWMAVGTALTGLSLALAAAESRIGDADLRGHSGLAARAPVLSGLFLALGFASVGVPGFLGFVGEDLLLHGLIESLPLMGIGLLMATSLNGWVLLRMHAALFLGPPLASPVGDVLPRERLALVGLGLVLFLAGTVPGPVVAARHRAATELSRLQGVGEPAPSTGH